MSQIKQARNNLLQRKDQLIAGFRNVILPITGTSMEKRVETISVKLAENAIHLFRRYGEQESPIVSSIRYQGDIQDVVQVKPRTSLSEHTAGDVVIYPSRIEGVDFLKKYNAWGFVKISPTRTPKYLALYVGRPESSLLYFGEIDTITQPLHSKDDIQKIQQVDMSTFQVGRRVIHLKPQTLIRFADPIPLGEKRLAPRSLRYTTLQKILHAQTIEDL
jgi:hypothetical protein